MVRKWFYCAFETENGGHETKIRLMCFQLQSRLFGYVDPPLVKTRDSQYFPCLHNCWNWGSLIQHHLGDGCDFFSLGQFSVIKCHLLGFGYRICALSESPFCGTCEGRKRWLLSSWMQQKHLQCRKQPPEKVKFPTGIAFVTLCVSRFRS